MKYVLLRAEFTNQPLYSEGGKADIAWYRERGFGEFDSRREAKYTWLVALQEIQAGEYEDIFIDRLYAPFQRMQLTRVGRLQDYPDYSPPPQKRPPRTF